MLDTQLIAQMLIWPSAKGPALCVKSKLSLLFRAFHAGRSVYATCYHAAMYSVRTFLLQHGAESALVEELSTRLGLALGMDSVESSISSNAIVLTTIKDGQCLTSTRKIMTAALTCTS